MHLSIHLELSLGFSGPATGVIWALRAKRWQDEFEMSSRGLSGPGVRKVQTRVENE